MSPDLHVPLMSTLAWRDQVVSSVVDALHAQQPGLAQSYGPRGLKACREDIQHHLDTLDGALATGETAVFSTYAVWLKEVLGSRGVPSAHLRTSFDLLAEFSADTLPPEDAERVRVILAEGSGALAREGLPSPYIYARVPVLADAPLYRQMALSGNHRGAAEVMVAAMQSGCTLSEAGVRLVQPAMYEVGRLWQENRITVAQEHLATAISQNVLARAYMGATFAPSLGRKALFAAVAGNHHCLGLRMLADGFETRGWDALYLGADVPLIDLVKQVDAVAPELLCLSLSLPSHLPVAKETVARLRAELGNRCPTIWVGGQVTLMGQGVWRSLRADGWAADTLHALEQVA